MTETISKKNLIAHRGFHPNDLNFILSTWLNGLRHGNELFGLIDQKSYFENYDAIIKSYLKRPDAEISVACLAEDSTVIMGYRISHGSVVDFVYVKSVWRNIGVARDLLPKEFTTVSHITKAGWEMIQCKYRGVKYDPFA